MSDILERLDDLRIFVRDNCYESKISMRAVVELYAGELLHDLRDAADEIEKLRAVVDAAQDVCTRYDIPELEAALRKLDGDP